MPFFVVVVVFVYNMCHVFHFRENRLLFPVLHLPREEQYILLLQCKCSSLSKGLMLKKLKWDNFECGAVMHIQI